MCSTRVRPRQPSVRPSVPILAALACILTGAAATTVSADILYDSRAMAINGSWNAARGSYIGGFGSFGQMFDENIADDFTVTGPVELTRVTADFWTSGSALASPADGWLVEVFADAGGRPAETPTHAVATNSFTRLGSFEWTGGGGFTPGFVTPDMRGTFEIDLTGHGVTLDAGTWWISVVAADESPFGAEYLWVGTDSSAPHQGSGAHWRNGGLAHGNGYGHPGGSGVPTAWTPFPASPRNDRPYELSMMIEGNVVPTPAAAMLFAAAGLVTGVKRRR